MDRVDTAANAARQAFIEHSGIPRPPWDELPEHRKAKWRKIAQAAILADKEYGHAG